MEELGSKDTSIRCETEEEKGIDFFSIFLTAGVVGLVMSMVALL